MEIPIKVRKRLDSIYEANDNMDYVVDYEGKYIPKKGDVFTIRHYHHIDRDRTNNEVWNLTPLTYKDHIEKIHTKNDSDTKQKIYNFMVEKYPDQEEHYRKYLLEEEDEKGVIAEKEIA